MKTTFHIRIISAALPILMSVSSCDTRTEQAVTEAQAQEQQVARLTKLQMQTAGITLGSIEQRAIAGAIKVNGVLDVPPQQLISVSAAMGGFVKQTDVLQGSKVSKGQRVAVIESIDYIQMQQDYLDVKSQLEFAKSDLIRQTELARENVNAQKTLQQATSNYGSLLARKNGLGAKLRMINIDTATLRSSTISSTTNLYSPINGFVTEVNVNIGKYVNSTDVLLEIVDTEHLHAELVIFEKDIPRIQIGQKVRFTLANETKDRTATVYLIGREISPDRTIRIHCHIDREDKNLLPGMYLKGIVEAGGATVDALPDEAIVDYLGKKFIFVLQSDQKSGDQASDSGFEMIEIQVGNRELGYTEVTLPENLDANAQIVVKGAYFLLSKMKNTEEED